ncbi:MAG: phage major capsid protein [Muribaculaceae bacterium]|nr:phage major capsid protein [Muribaculaceae bacterium]
MKKTKRNPQAALRELITRHQENCARIQEICDACEAENRERNEAEEAEYVSLVRDNSIIGMKIQSIQSPEVPRNVNPDTLLRESLENRQTVTVMLVRDLMMTPDLDGTGIIPIQQQEMLKPLRAGLIWDKVGLTVRTGLRGGTLRWPRHGKGQAHWLAEGERMEDTKIDFTKLETKPERLGCPIKVTREELNDSEGIVEGVVREEMPAAIIDLVNEALFTVSATYTDSKGTEKNRVIHGPFVKASESAMQFAGAVPTRRELLKMKARVTKAGIKLIAPCWVMTEDMKAELEDTKVDAGSGRFLCENDHILGYPVFTTPHIGEGNIGFGDWSYQAAGFFDSMNLIVDPYTLARENSVDFVLNARFGTVTLYEEAFVLGQAKGA